MEGAPSELLETNETGRWLPLSPPVDCQQCTNKDCPSPGGRVVSLNVDAGSGLWLVCGVVVLSWMLWLMGHLVIYFSSVSIEHVSIRMNVNV